MPGKPLKDDPEDSPIKEEINIERQLDKRQGLSTIRERVEVQHSGQQGSAIERTIAIPLDKKLEEKPTQSSIAQQRVEQEINAYETFLKETGENRLPRRNQQTDEASQINGFFREEALQGYERDEDDEELDAILDDLTKKLNMSERNVTDDRNEFPDILYERERSLLMNTITDDEELDEALEFLKIEYLLTAHDKLQNLEEKINNKYDEEIRLLLEEAPEDLNEVLEFLEQERQIKLEYIDGVKRNIEKMSKPPRTPPRRKIFGLSPIQEESYVSYTPTPQRLPPLTPRPFHESPIFPRKLVISSKRIPSKVSALPKQQKPDRSAIERMIEARRAAALKARERAKAAQLRPSRAEPSISWGIVSQRALPQRPISSPLKTLMSTIRREAAEKARAKAAQFRTMKPRRIDWSRVSIPAQPQAPQALSPKSRLKKIRREAAEKARAEAARLRPSKPRPSTSREIVSQRALPQRTISGPIKTLMSTIRREAAEKARAEAAQFRTMKPSRTDLSSIRIPAQPQAPQALSPKSRLKKIRREAAEKARAEAARLRPSKPRPSTSWEIVSQRALPQRTISGPIKTLMSTIRREAAEKARAEAAQFRTMKPSRTDLSSIRVPAQPQAPQALSPKSRLKKIRREAAEKARAEAARLRPSKPRPSTSREIVSQRALPQRTISGPIKTLMSTIRREAAEKARAEAAQFRTMKPSRTDLSSIRVPAQPQAPQALSPKSRLKKIRREAAEKARAEAARLRSMKPSRTDLSSIRIPAQPQAPQALSPKSRLKKIWREAAEKARAEAARLRSMISKPAAPVKSVQGPESAPMVQPQIPGPPQKIQFTPGTMMRQARESAAQYERERVARIRAAENNLKHRFNEEKEILKQTIEDPNELEEELEFLKLEYESKLKDLRNIENLEKVVEQRYRQRAAEAADDKDLMEFLEEEFKAELELIQEGVGLRKSESFTVKSIFPPSRPKETISAVQAPVTTPKKVIKPRGIPSRSTIKLKNKVMRDLEKLQKKSEVNRDVLEAVEGIYTPKVKLSTESIKPLAEKLGIKEPEKVKIILDKARKKSYQVKKKLGLLPPTLAENITKRGIEQLEIDPLQKEEADAIVHTMMLEKNGISMKKDPKDITNLLVPSDAPKVDILGNAIEITENSILAKTIPTREINAINPLASEEIALTLKAHPLQVPPEGIVSKSIGEKMKLPVAKLLKKPDYKVDYLECDIVLNSYNVENKFQARGSVLPKWFPGFFSAFPDEKVNLQPYKSPSEILRTAWSKMKPEYYR